VELLANHPPNPEVSEKNVRRHLTVKYKVEILRQADHCRMPRVIEDLLRREDSYSSHLSTLRWQKYRVL